MANNKHTPGPWSYDADENEIHSDSTQEAGGDPAHICTMLGSNIEKNVALIAAAPEMLEALETVERLTTDLKILAGVRAAIKKARGE